MTSIILAVTLLGASPAKPLDEVLTDGTIHHHFDYELMAKIHARNEAKRAAMKEWDYDPVTWLPVAKEKPKHPRPYKRDNSSLAATRMHRAALRRQQSQVGGADPLWWIYAPAMPNPRCPWSYVRIPATGY